MDPAIDSDELVEEAVDITINNNQHNVNNSNIDGVFKRAPDVVEEELDPNSLQDSAMMNQGKNWSFIVNLGNSIIGVSVLAMPFCFKKCGIVLGPLVLLFCSWLTQVSCRLLMKAAISSKRRSYEFLAYHTFGAMGKLCVEISIIGLLVGTCIAFHVIIGDLGPAIISKLFGIENTSTLRTLIMVFLGMFVAFPLGLLRNVDSLTGLCAVSMGFYGVFVLKMFTIAAPNLLSAAWYTSMDLWNPSAIFQSLPIFSLAFACQTQLFVIYDALPDPSLHKMNRVMSGAVTLCGTVYLMVGFFGCVAFYNSDIAGDVLLSFVPSFVNELIKLAFVLSVAISFPLVVFPCRASLHSLLFSQAGGTHGNISGPSVIPPTRFKVITFVLVGGTLIIGICIPDVEFILGLTGATMGTMICFIFPAVMYMQVMGKTGNNGHMYARLVFFLGVIFLVASTYSTLMSHDKAVAEQSIAERNKPADHPQPLKEIMKNVEKGVQSSPDLKGGGGNELEANIQKPAKVDSNQPEVAVGKDDEKRQEPPNPQEPAEEGVKKETENKESQEKGKEITVAAGAVSEKVKRDVGDVDKNEVKKLLDEFRDEQKKILKEQKEIVAELKVHQKEAHPDQIANKKQKLIEEKHEEIKKDLSNLLEKIQGMHNTGDEKVEGNGVETNQVNGANMPQPNAGNVQQPNVVNAQQPNVANIQQPNVANVQQPNVANVQQPNVANVQQPNVANVQQPNVANVQQPNVANVQQPNVANVQQPNVANVQQPNVANVQQPNVANVQQPNVANVQQPNVANVQQPNVANVQQPNVANVQQPNVANVQQQLNVANVQQQPNVANVQQQPNVANVQQQPNVANVQQPNVANVQQPNVANVQQPNVANVQQPNVANVQQPNVANVQQPNVANVQQPNVANVQQPNVANVQQPNVANVQQPNVANAQQSNIANAQQLNVAIPQQPNIPNVHQAHEANVGNAQQLNIGNEQQNVGNAPQQNNNAQPKSNQGLPNNEMQPENLNKKARTLSNILHNRRIGDNSLDIELLLKEDPKKHKDVHQET